MSERNCINCGAVIEIDNVKCPYCGTSYFDFTNIELDGKPVVLKLKHNNQIFMLKAICTSCDIAIENYPSSLYCDGLRVCTLQPHNVETTVNIEFTGVGEYT